jgi:isoleucyl-tRNA synthetase
MIDTYGADALRLYMIYSPVVRAEDLRFSEHGVKELLRHILIPLWNSYAFFVTYANIDGWQPDGEAGRSANVLDRWILSSLETLTQEVVSAMDEYDLQRAVRPFVKFIEDLTNWYIRRSRRRFWKSQDDDDKAQAYRTLYHVLLQLSKIAAPFVPFMSESIYRNLRTADMPESVHLCDFPLADPSHRAPELEEEMELVATVVRLGRLLRSANDLKVRQPLPVLHVVSRNAKWLERIEALGDIALDELNVKRLAFGSHETELAVLKAKADFKRLGPRLGPKVKAAAAAIAALDGDSIERLLSDGRLSLEVGGAAVELTSEDVVVERIPKQGMVVAAEGALVVALETALTEELVMEGLARELVNKVQSMRKAVELEVTQRIRIEFSADEAVRKAIERHADYVKTETLCAELAASGSGVAGGSEWDLNGHPCVVAIRAL